VPRRKWNVERRNVQVDDVVIVADGNAMPGKWNVGRVVEVYPGQDGKLRNIKVKTASGEYSRPVTKIAVIQPVEDADKRIDKNIVLMEAEDVSLTELYNFTI
jgi:hypothetical protein